MADWPLRAVKLRPATPDDAAAIALIYAPYVTASAVSFEVDPPDAAEVRVRIESGGDLYPWIVGLGASGEIAGYAYASAFRPRPAYRYAVETSVYVAAGAQGQGLGGKLYRALIETLEAQGFAQAIAAISLPNDASVRLHEALGFTPAGAYRQVGYKLGGWWDVGLWQRALGPAANPPREPVPLSKTKGYFSP
jgi:phosphinothricin acetyltransferase